MELEVEPPSLLILNFYLAVTNFDLSLAISFIILILLIISSALISGSEIAFFSLSPKQLNTLSGENDNNSRLILKLKEKQSKLLATILIGNNLVNIAIVLVSNYILTKTLGDLRFLQWANSLKSLPVFNNFSTELLKDVISFTITVIGVTFILVLFGEVMPKLYASVNNIKLAKRMATPLNIMMKLFSPLSNFLVNWTNIIERRLDRSKASFTSSDKDNLENALDLTLKSDDEDLEMLKSILKFNDVSVKQIMRPRIDVVALDKSVDYDEVLKTVRESGYSRIPVYEEDFDNVVGILYAKDLISHLNNTKDFKWQNLIRKNVLFVPESKKINSLLKEFQNQKLHMAIVVDEYGGTSGIITMEDIMEEILGEIIDEFDDVKEVDYKKIDDKTYIFEGKTLLIDFVKVFDLNIQIFNQYKGESDSLAGLILELKGSIPENNEKIELGNFIFIIEEVSNRRIEKVKVIVNDVEEN